MSRKKLSPRDYKALNRATLGRRIPPGGGPPQLGPIRNAKAPRARARRRGGRGSCR